MPTEPPQQPQNPKRLSPVSHIVCETLLINTKLSLLRVPQKIKARIPNIAANSTSWAGLETFIPNPDSLKP